MIVGKEEKREEGKKKMRKLWKKKAEKGNRDEE